MTEPRRTSGAALLVAMVIATLSFTTPAGAQDACDLIDDYGQLSDVQGLRAAIEQAEQDTGVDFFVYAVDDIPDSSNPEAELAAAARIACPAAFDSPANVSDNTVVLAVAVSDRFTAVSYGDDLDERLDDDDQDIIGRMNGFFANGEIGAGLASGVGGTVEGLSTTPPDYATPIGVGVAGTAAVVGSGMWLYGRRRMNKANSEQAKSWFDEGANRITEVQARWYDAEQEATIVGGRITGAAMSRLDTAQLAAAEASRTLYETWSPVSEVTSDDVAEMSDDALGIVRGHVDASLAVVVPAEENTAALEAVVEELRTMPDDLAAMHTKASEQITAGLNDAEARAAEGWEVAAGQQRLADLSGALAGIDPFAMRIDVDEVAQLLEPIADTVDSVASDLAMLEERHGETGVRRSSMSAEIEGQRGRAMQMRAKMHEWAQAHATASFAELRQHPDEAERLLQRAGENAQAAHQVGDIPRDLGIMRMVNAELDTAQNAIDLADELLDEGDEMDILLAAAKENGLPAVAASADDATILINYVNEHHRDLPSRAPQVAHHVRDLQVKAESSLRLSPPDYLLAMELAGQIESIVNTELDEFKVTVGERQRQRNHAMTAVRSASVAVDRADRHVQTHMFSARADRDAQQQIDRLRAQLNTGVEQVDSNPQAAGSIAAQVEQSADEIYREAQRRQRYRGGRGGPFGGGFGGGIIIGGGGFRGHGGGRSHRGGGWGGGGGGGFGGGFGGGSSGGWGGGGGGFGGGSSGGW